MLKSNQRVALFYSRLNINEARILYMPFIKNFLKCLDEENIKVDVFLAEKKNHDYEGEFSGNIRIHFVDSRVFWRLSRMKLFYTMLKFILFSFSLFLRKRYSLIVGGGVLGNHVAVSLGKLMGVKTIYMGDEFPILARKFWNDTEIKACAAADLVIVPDVTRIAATETIVKKKLNNVCVLPNAPLQRELEHLPEINWHVRLNVPAEVKFVLFAGGTMMENQLLESMVEIPRLPENFRMIIIANERAKWAHKNLLKDERYIWLSKPLTDAELYSLIGKCLCCIGLYRTDFDLLEYVGMSSGKIMRSIACGTPVVTSVAVSLDFVTQMNLGVQLEYTCFMPEAIIKISQQRDAMRQSCLDAFKRELSYDVFWQKSRPEILALINSGVNHPKLNR